MTKKVAVKKKIKSRESIMCWDHCHRCNRSQNRFWITSDEQFEKERVETLGHECSFCGGNLKSYREDKDL